MTEEDFKLLQDKYGNLVYYTALRISGDKSQSPEDYVNSIWAYVLHFLPKYMTQENVPTVKEFISKYDGWVKQWIFTYKNMAGANINSKRLNQVSSLNDSEDRDFDVPDNSYSDLENLEFVSLVDRFPNTDLGIVAKAILTYDDVFTDGGRLNLLALQRRTKISVPKLRKILLELQSSIHTYIDYEPNN
jgi:hypothetical protein